MHEYSVVQALIDKCEEYVHENSASRVIKVAVKIGIRSGVEPHLLKEAFETFKEDSVCAGSEFIMDIQNLKIECLECGKVFEVDDDFYICKSCKSDNIKVIDGEDMMLMSLELI